eukprot:34497-Rhodomonas_salina.2
MHRTLAARRMRQTGADRTPHRRGRLLVPGNAQRSVSATHALPGHAVLAERQDRHHPRPTRQSGGARVGPGTAEEARTCASGQTVSEDQWSRKPAISTAASEAKRNCTMPVELRTGAGAGAEHPCSGTETKRDGKEERQRDSATERLADTQTHGHIVTSG